MKIKTLFTAGLLALVTGSAFAADLGVVYITGSSAYRVATVTAIQALYKPATLQVGSVGALNGSTYAIFKGELLSGDTVTICTDFTGSAAGVQAIVQTTTNGLTGQPANIPAVKYIDPATVLAAAPSSTTALTTPTYTHGSGIALSDVNYYLTAFTRATDLTPNEAADSPVGVIPFYWVKNNGASASITNITNQIVKGLAAGGLPLSFFSGATTGSDLTTQVRIVGRNADSGTRLTAFEEGGYGALTVATQYAPSGATQGTNGSGQAAGSGDITSFSLWQAETILGLPFAAGESGFASGGTLATVMTRTSSAGPIVTYLGKSDAKAAVTGGATVLSYNGVMPEDPVTATSFPSFTSGKYSFWSYEHLYYNNQTTGTGTIAELLATEVKKPANAALSGIDLASMMVSRGGEGQVVTP